MLQVVGVYRKKRHKSILFPHPPAPSPKIWRGGVALNLGCESPLSTQRRGDLGVRIRITICRIILV